MDACDLPDLTKVGLANAPPSKKLAHLAAWATAAKAPDDPLRDHFKWAWHDIVAELAIASGHDHSPLTQATLAPAEEREAKVEFAFCYFFPIFSIATAADPRSASNNRRGRPRLSDEEVALGLLAHEAWLLFKESVAPKRKSIANDFQEFREWLDNDEGDKFLDLAEVPKSDWPKLIDIGRRHA